MVATLGNQRFPEGAPRDYRGSKDGPCVDPTDPCSDPKHVAEEAGLAQNHGYEQNTNFLMHLSNIAKRMFSPLTSIRQPMRRGRACVRSNRNFPSGRRSILTSEYCADGTLALTVRLHGERSAGARTGCRARSTRLKTKSVIAAV